MACAFGSQAFLGKHSPQLPGRASPGLFNASHFLLSRGEDDCSVHISLEDAADKRRLEDIRLILEGDRPRA